ncbi:MAG TPA: hypothetical protein VM370_07090 [Candidatus Thermoplasmatota archaeon]|nr:hypothetical protein [Candidatus Thermoplasmatota archaeon]
MRPLCLLVTILLLAPSAFATHGTERDLTGEVHDGSSIVMALEASGTVSAHGAGSKRNGGSLEEASHDYRFAYSWGGTLELKLGADGFLFGDAQLTGGGTGALADHTRLTVYNYEGGVENVIDTDKTCDVDMKIYGDGKRHARGLMDPETGDLFVIVDGLGQPRGENRCTWTSEGSGSETSTLFPSPPMSPLFAEGVSLVDQGDARAKKVAPLLDGPNAANALVFSIQLKSGHSILRGGASDAFPVEYEPPMGYACPNAMDEEILQGACSASGTLEVRILVDPCPVLRESRAVHLAAVKALQQPANGSSEAQVRAFQVDVRQKLVALLADERAIQLLCASEEGPEVLDAMAEAMQKVVDAWVDVAKAHGLSDEGKRDLLAAERGRQLSGGGEASVSTSEILNAVIDSPGAYGAVTIKAHSPVALHAWDEAGRHVGWNETTKAPDAQVPGSNYTGEPGGAQELALPSGFYKVAVVELGDGRYTLNTGWNGTAGEGFELLPLASAKGRTMVTNVLLDQHGFLAGPAQRVASADIEPASFVEAWRPLPNTQTPEAGSGGAHDDGDGAGDTGRGAPAPGAGVLVALVAAAALVARGRRER